jgi:hypothetical protein
MIKSPGTKTAGLVSRRSPFEPTCPSSTTIHDYYNAAARARVDQQLDLESPPHSSRLYDISRQSDHVNKKSRLAPALSKMIPE